VRRVDFPHGEVAWGRLRCHTKHVCLEEDGVPLLVEGLADAQDGEVGFGAAVG